MMNRSFLKHLNPRIFSQEILHTANNKSINGVTAGNRSAMLGQRDTLERMRMPISAFKQTADTKALSGSASAGISANDTAWKLSSSMQDLSVNIKRMHYTTACSTNTFARFPSDILFQRSGFRALRPSPTSLPHMVGTQRRFVHNLFPKRSKFTKQFKGTMKGICHNGSTVAYGEYGLQALKNSWITSKQLEAGRRVLIRSARAGGKIWIRVFPDKPVTLRPTETRMGRGKGNHAFWVAVVQPGQVIYEVSGVPEVIAKEAFKVVGSKMPVQTRVISRV